MKLKVFMRKQSITTTCDLTEFVQGCLIVIFCKKVELNGLSSSQERIWKKVLRKVNFEIKCLTKKYNFTFYFVSIWIFWYGLKHSSKFYVAVTSKVKLHFAVYCLCKISPHNQKRTLNSVYFMSVIFPN